MTVQAVDSDKPVSDTPAEVGGSLLGRVLADQGKITDQDIETIVRYAREKKLRFGEAALELKLVAKADLEHALAEQFDYPFLSAGEGGFSDELVAAYRPFSKKGQSLRNLRTRLMQQWPPEGSQALAVVGSGVGEGSTYIAANLAVVFSQLGQRTLLIDADMLNARLHQVFNLKNNVGLSAVLVGRTPVDTVIKRLPLFRDLSVITAGAPPPNAAELLGRREVAAIIDRLKQRFDIVIFDTPPASALSGAELVAASCGNSLLVLRQDRTYLKEAEAAVDMLRHAGANVIGTVMTKF